ncbi:MAG: hypothetical protein KBT36_11775 [Kurthia sp.]|nr:hypothetical protein [Candidatus Kurthia equi]
MNIFRSARKKIFYGVLGGAAGMLAITSVIGYVGYTKMQEKELALIEKYEQKIEELEIIASNSEVAYSLRDPVVKGEVITESMIQKVYIPKGAKADDSLLLPDLQSNGEPVLYAKTDLNANTVLTMSMFYLEENITNDIREGEYSFIEIPSNVKNDSYVDIRIQFPTGDDFVVLSKKKVKDITGLTMQMNVAEGEILTLSSAVVDAYIEGAKIYSVPYVDEHMQEESIMTYPLKENVKELLQSSPNVLNIAKYHLEKQNRQRLENYLEVMSIEQKSLVESGESSQSSKVEADTARRTQEERLNEANQTAEQQQDLIGGE